MAKIPLTISEEKFNSQRFEEVIDTIRAKLKELEEVCIEDEVLRDTVIVSMEGYCRQLEAIRMACTEGKSKD